MVKILVLSFGSPADIGNEAIKALLEMYSNLHTVVFNRSHERTTLPQIPPARTLVTKVAKKFKTIAGDPYNNKFEQEVVVCNEAYFMSKKIPRLVYGYTEPQIQSPKIRQQTSSSSSKPSSFWGSLFSFCCSCDSALPESESSTPSNKTR